MTYWQRPHWRSHRWLSESDFRSTSLSYPYAPFLQVFVKKKERKSAINGFRLCIDKLLTLERLGESGATHDSQSASRSGVEAWVARNLNGWDDSDAGLSEGWFRCPSGLASLHHSRLSTRSSYQLYSFSGDRRFCHDNHGSFVYDSPNLFCGPSGSVRTGLTGVRSEPGHRTHLYIKPLYYSVLVSGLPRSTATSIHPFVQYAKVTLLEISPCQCPTVKRPGVAYSCAYALLINLIIYFKFENQMFCISALGRKKKTDGSEGDHSIDLSPGLSLLHFVAAF